MRGSRGEVPGSAGDTHTPRLSNQPHLGMRSSLDPWATCPIPYLSEPQLSS